MNNIILLVFIVRAPKGVEVRVQRRHAREQQEGDSYRRRCVREDFPGGQDHGGEVHQQLPHDNRRYYRGTPVAY